MTRTALALWFWLFSSGLGCSQGAPPPTAAPDSAAPESTVAVPPPRIALVLGGGGARGFAHVGVLRVLEQEKVPIDLVVGTSVGSLIGALYAAEPDTFQLEWKAFQIEEDDLFDFSLLSAAASMGPVRGEAIQSYLKQHVKKPNIEDFPVRYVAIATDLKTGERVELDSGSVVQAVRASVSIPGVFAPVKVGERWLVDGGVVANVAVDVARARGADIVIASDISAAVSGGPITNVVDVLLQSINIMMAQMSREEIAKADVILAPDIGDVGTLDFSQKKRCLEAGIAATRGQVGVLRQAIADYYEKRGGRPPPSGALSLNAVRR